MAVSVDDVMTREIPNVPSKNGGRWSLLSKKSMAVFLSYIEVSERTVSLALAIALFFIISLSIISNCYSFLANKRYFSGRVLFVTAHPDDECMFFGPSILNAVENGGSPCLLCLSTGNFYGRGKERILELVKSCLVLGIPASNLTIIDDKALPDDPSAQWDRDIVGRYILEAVVKYKITTVVTFDQFGISEHANHKAVRGGLWALLQEKVLGNEGMKCVYELETTNRLRKYIGLVDVLISIAISRFVVCTGFRGHLRIMRGMKAHQSQLTWFRILYMTLSRYVHVNTLNCVWQRDRT